MSLIEYIRNPKIISDPKVDAFNIGKLFFIYWFAASISIPIIYLISHNFKLSHFQIQNHSGMLIPFGVFLAPVYEEILFRLGLIPTKKNFYILLFSLLCLSVFELIKKKYFLSVSFSVLFVLVFLAGVLINKTLFKQLFNKYFKYIFWMSALFFGFAHLSNFKGNIQWLVLFSPFLCFPQILMGFIIGYIRMNYGFLYGVLFHIIINLSLLLNLFKK